MGTETAISVRSVSKDFKLKHAQNSSLKAHFTSLFRDRSTTEIQHALNGVSFDVKKGEFFGVVGRNGSGKSTLLKILAGIYQPTKGKVHVEGKLVPFIELGVGFNPELTGRENVFLNGALLGFSEKEVEGFYDQVVEFAELQRFMDKKLKNYSSGMQVRLAFAMAVRAQADILLIDEVLAVGDADFQRKCFEYFRQLKKGHQTVVFVSHDMGAVQRYCDRALLLNDSKVVEVGDANTIATMYNELFVTKTPGRKGPVKTNPSGEVRWGDGSAEWKDVQARVNKEKQREVITIKATGMASQDIDFPIYGFSIKNEDFTQLAGTNTVRLNKKTNSLKKGQKFSVEWQVRNIFNDGRFYVDCTIAHDQVSMVADRWPDATSFYVSRADDNPYHVYAEIECKVEG